MRKITYVAFLLLVLGFYLPVSAQTATSSLEGVSQATLGLQTVASSTRVVVIKTFEEGLIKAKQDILSKKTGIEDTSLNSAIQSSRLNILSKIQEVLGAPDVSVVAKTDTLEKDIKDSIALIEKELTTASGVKVTINSFPAIQVILEAYKKDAAPFVIALNQDKGNLLFVDSDNDGISDYDEIYVYHTDPHKAKTVSGALTDGQKVLRGINPLSTSSAQISYSDVKAVSATTSVFSVSNVELKKTATSSQVVFTGRALPNSIVTLYVFSTPIIVAVKADAAGRWTYSLDKELENGKHEIYVATVDNSGKVVAKSSGIPFVKTAEAASLDTQNVANVSNTGTVLGFLSTYLWQFLSVILGVMLVAGLLLIGKDSNTPAGPSTPGTPDVTA